MEGTMKTSVAVFIFVVLATCCTGLAVADPGSLDDPPGAFLRVAPPDTFLGQDHYFYVLFSWTPSQDPDGDTVRYIFHCAIEHYSFPGAFPSDAVITDTSLAVMLDIPSRSGALDMLNYYWTVRATDGTDTVDASNGEGHFWVDFLGVQNSLSLYPSSLSLSSAPNPFNSTALITYDLPTASLVELKIVNLVGEVVAVLESGNHTPGHYQTIWNANNQASGTYFVLLISGNGIKIQKLLLLK
jgi:hypothetical protein